MMFTSYCMKVCNIASGEFPLAGYCKGFLDFEISVWPTITLLVG